MAETTTSAEQQRLALHSGDLLRQAAFINGRWVVGSTTLDVINPATQQLLGRVPALGAAETEIAIAGAARAFESWRRVSAGERGSILQRWFELIMDNQEDLARLMTAEQGKPLSESRGEVAYAASFIEWFAQESRRAYGQVIPGHMADKRPGGIARATGRRRGRHALEFPRRHDYPQGGAGAGGGLYDRAEALRAHTLFCTGFGVVGEPGRRAGGSVQRGDGRACRHRRGTDHRSAGAQIYIHRIDPNRQAARRPLHGYRKACVAGVGRNAPFIVL